MTNLNLLLFFIFFYFLSLFYLSVTEDWEIRCCDGLGCFTDEPPFDHLPAPWCQDKIAIRFLLYTRRNQDSPQQIERDYIPPIFDGSRPRTVFIVHGYLSSFQTPWIKELVDAFLANGDYNVIAVDWSGGSIDPGIDYPQAAANTRVTGTEIAIISKKLQNERKVLPNATYCIGHSLGAHTCGFAGKKGKFGRITGLDPAGPLWYYNIPEARLDKNDADFVDCIHTHAAGGPILDLGIGKPIGDVDFFPNNAGMQPGCITLSKIEEIAACSHHRAIRFFMESLISSCSFTSVPCKSIEDQIDGKCRFCEKYDCQHLGITAENFKNRTGTFWLRTYSEKPFCVY